MTDWRPMLEKASNASLQAWLIQCKDPLTDAAAFKLEELEEKDTDKWHSEDRQNALTLLLVWHPEYGSES